MTASSMDFSIHFDAQEREMLLRLLQQAREDAHAERRRTEAPGYRELLAEQQARIERVIGKFEQAQHEPLEAL
jgi:hypothetical protein